MKKIFKQSVIHFAPKLWRKWSLYHSQRAQQKSRALQYGRFSTYLVKTPTVAPASRKKLLHVIGNFWTGGSAQLVVDIAERLGELYEQEVLTRDVPETPAYAGLPVNVVLRDEEIEGLLRDFSPDLIHVHYLGHQRDSYGKEDFTWYEKVFKLAEKINVPIIENINIFTDPFPSKNVFRYVYVSDKVRQQFAKHDQRDAVIYPGSDFSHFKAVTRAEERGNCIGMVYRLERDKLSDASIEVFIQVLKFRKKAKALIVGGGTLLDFFRQRVGEEGLNGRVTFTGYVGYQELPELYRKMDIFVAPVHRESFGQVTPFAMSMGLPVAGYNVGALPEILGTDELLAEPGNLGQLVTILLTLLDDPTGQLAIGKRNQERAHAFFSLEKMISDYTSLYEQALQNGKPFSPMQH